MPDTQNEPSDPYKFVGEPDAPESSQTPDEHYEYEDDEYQRRSRALQCRVVSEMLDERRHNKCARIAIAIVAAVFFCWAMGLVGNLIADFPEADWKLKAIPFAVVITGFVTCVGVLSSSFSTVKRKDENPSTLWSDARKAFEVLSNKD